jgi:aminopeptidase N
MKNMPYLFLLILILSSCATAVSEDHFYEPGISLELAKFRKQQISDIHYTLDFSIPKNKYEGINSFLKLDLTISNLEHPIILDFNEKSENIKSIYANGKPTEIKHEQEHIIIDPKNLKSGANKLEIEFIAGDLSLTQLENRIRQYFVIQLVTLIVFTIGSQLLTSSHRVCP